MQDVRVMFDRLRKNVSEIIPLTDEEQYTQLLEEYPSIVQRVAQRHIASYLGITPEGLSRIRHRITAKGKP